MCFRKSCQQSPKSGVGMNDRRTALETPAKHRFRGTEGKRSHLASVVGIGTHGTHRLLRTTAPAPRLSSDSSPPCPNTTCSGWWSEVDSPYCCSLLVTSFSNRLKICKGTKLCHGMILNCLIVLKCIFPRDLRTESFLVFVVRFLGAVTR